MALTDKLTAIANAIRAKTGGSSALTLTEMATEISNIQTGSTNSLSFTATISADSTGEISINPSGNTTIADHFNDSSFTVSVVKGEPAASTGLCMISMVASNTVVRENMSTATYGVGIRGSNDGLTAMYTIYKSPSAASTRAGGTVSVSSNGVVSIYGSGTIPIKAGTYRVTCSW